MNVSLIISKDKYKCSYIITLSSYLYSLQEELNMYGQVISLGKLVCEGTFFLRNINYRYYVSSYNKIKYQNCIFEKNINGKVTVICYE